MNRSTLDWHAITWLAAGSAGPCDFGFRTACPIPAVHRHGRGKRDCRKAKTDQKSWDESHIEGIGRMIVFAEGLDCFFLMMCLENDRQGI